MSRSSYLRSGGGHKFLVGHNSLHSLNQSVKSQSRIKINFKKHTSKGISSDTGAAGLGSLGCISDFGLALKAVLIGGGNGDALTLLMTISRSSWFL